MSKIKISNQSFRDAGGTEIYPNLDIEGIVQTITFNHKNSFEELMTKAHYELINKADKLGCTHIFGVEHKVYTGHGKHPSYGTDYVVTGTAYKPKE